MQKLNCENCAAALEVKDVNFYECPYCHTLYKDGVKQPSTVTFISGEVKGPVFSGHFSGPVFITTGK